MTIRLSKWTKWADRNDLPNLDKKGVYLIAEGRGINGRPSVRDLTDKTIYIGCTPKGPLCRRLHKFDQACKGHTGHPKGRAYFAENICPEFMQAVECEVARLGVKPRQARQKIRSSAEFQHRLEEFADLWEERQKRIKLAVWIPTKRWKERYPELSEELQIRLVEAKLQVRFVEQHRCLPKYNMTFG